MEKLDFIKLLKKISQIVFERAKTKHTASVLHIFTPEIMLINLNGIYAKVQKFWEKNAVAIITHENIHSVIANMINTVTSIALDNLWESTEKSRFFIDGNPKWFEWRISNEPRSN